LQLPKSHTTVPPSQNIGAPYVGVGEQPGREEVKRRQVFVGPAGKELDDCLGVANISRPLIYLTNIIKDLDRPINSYIQLYNNSKLLSEPIISDRGKEYIEFLKWELSKTSAEYFLAIGGIALFILTGRIGITKWRGSLLDCTLIPGRKVIPTIHPATIIPPKNNFLNRRLLIFDLKRLRSLTENLTVPTERVYELEPSFETIIKFLNFCRDKGLSGSRISYDIEVYMNRKYKQISCIAFAVDLQSICIPFADHLGDYFTIAQEAEIWQIIAEILEDSKIKICGQNLIFDNHFLLRTYGIRTTNIDDTMIAQQMIMADYPKGLDFITSIWTDHPYYKADGKAFFKGGGQYYKFWKYNATDALICDEAFPKQREELVKLGIIETYNNQIALIEPLVYMMERGIRVDITGMEAADQDHKKQLIEAQEELDTIVGRPLNAKSPKQLNEYFFIEKGITPYKAKGKTTYNDLAMKRLIRKGWKEAKIIQRIRKLTKLKSTYLDITKIDADKRLRCSYNPVGTRYSRISSSKNLWGSGTNLQNFPHHIQDFLIPDPGYAYYAFDLSQAENRIVAYVGDILEMIQCFETGEDVHAKSARMIMKTYYGSGYNSEKISVEDPAPIGDGTQEWRFWGKKANHGFNYDWSYKNFALANELPESDGKLIYTAYHNLYPGVQQSFHTYVRKCLRTTRILKNLMGRKTVFLGPLTGRNADKTFKEAYSCIPQGTVGDIVNKKGINYIYYNQDLFKPIELLRQIHDEIDFQIPINIGWKEHARMLKLIKSSLEIPLTTHNGRTFTIPADLTLGRTLNKDNKKTSIHIDFTGDLSDNLKTSWEKINNA